MNKRLIRAIEFAMVLAAGFVGYIIAVGGLSTPALVEAARPVVMPEKPHILYLAPENSQRGKVNSDEMTARGAGALHDWQSARSATRVRALDAMLIDASLFDSLTPSDADWLRAQFHDGAVIVGFGVDEDRFAKALGLETIRAPTETALPPDPNRYILVMSLILGSPDDIGAQDRNDWILQLLHGGDEGTVSVKQPLINQFSGSRGRLDSEEELEVLFHRVNLSIQGAYETRAEFRRLVENLEKK
jgi:hypothetical protein